MNLIHIYELFSKYMVEIQKEAQKDVKPEKWDKQSYLNQFRILNSDNFKDIKIARYNIYNEVHIYYMLII